MELGEGEGTPKFLTHGFCSAVQAQNRDGTMQKCPVQAGMLGVFLTTHVS